MTGCSANNILHIVEDLKVGGLEKMLASIVLSLDKSKYDVQVWCLARGGDIAQALIAQGISLRILNMDGYYCPLQIVALARLMRKEDFHIIHTHGYFASTFGRLAAIWARIPVVITHVHSTYYDYGKRNLLIERFLSYFTDRIICISRAVETFVTVNEGISKKRTCLIYNAVNSPVHIDDEQHKQEVRNSIGIDAGAIVIMVVASLTANKGHLVLLEAFAQVSRTHPAVRLVIVGDGPLRKDIETVSRKLMIDQAVSLLGVRNDVFELLQASDIFVLPSQIREGLGVSLIEAMAVGLPVIGTNLGGIPEVILDGENGFLVSPESPEQLAEVLMKFVNDQGLRNSMGRRGRQIYEEKFTLSKMIRQVETLYDQLLENKTHALRT